MKQELGTVRRGSRLRLCRLPLVDAFDQTVIAVIDVVDHVVVIVGGLIHRACRDIVVIGGRRLWWRRFRLRRRAAPIRPLFMEFEIVV